ncbi:DUF6462 family protein [Butyrivibrio sp. YAB3001]|uniref:DUF6462 family protein n=1 Tax=Butyrivibrio sp. YAB3001 TaxID=1520812 RepID=UPI0008F67BED|nr:DUF6462 family protein [Butyrivibrio sp. YAB3001]SFC57239.1 hypothetical protein SAMN02910398_02607 [Butyrivibrio sp. YAB3001]
MPKPRAKELVPDLENMIVSGQKKFVRYDNGVELYSVCDKTLRDWVRESGAEYKIGRMVLINTNILDEWLENFRTSKQY